MIDWPFINVAFVGSFNFVQRVGKQSGDAKNPMRMTFAFLLYGYGYGSAERKLNRQTVNLINTQ